jgi:hypothetical protein
MEFGKHFTTNPPGNLRKDRRHGPAVREKVEDAKARN